jgi:hypothetical protein
VLLITEVAVVVDHLEAVSALAIGASIGLLDSSSLNELIMGELALEALKAGFFHLRNDI